MIFKEFAKEAVSELLIYLADNEDFKSLKGVSAFTQSDVRRILRELAQQLKEEENLETNNEKRPQYDDLELSSQAMALISSLSPREELLLFKSFKII